MEWTMTLAFDSQHLCREKSLWAFLLAQESIPPERGI